MSTLVCQLPHNKWQLPIVGGVERNGAADAVLEPCLEAFQRQWLEVDGELVDEELGPLQEVGEIAGAEHAYAALPHAMARDHRVPLDVHCQERLCIRHTCPIEMHRQNLSAVCEKK